MSSSQSYVKNGPEVEESGYLTFVSSQKKKINDASVSYWNFELEQEDKTRRGVCFEPEIREEFKSREGQSVKISCKRQLYDDALIICKKQCIQEAALNFPVMRFKGFEFETILDIKKDQTVREVNSILTLMECKYERKMIGTRNGPCPLKVFIVSDTTANIDLDVWGDETINILEIGKTYSFKKLKTFVFISQKLATMLDTEIEPIRYSPEHNLNEIFNIKGRNAEVSHCKEEQLEGNLIANRKQNFQESVGPNVSNIKQEPNLDSREDIRSNSETFPTETPINIESSIVNSNNEEIDDKIGIEYTEGKETENLDSHTNESHLCYTGAIYSILIDEYYLCGKCHGRNEIPLNDKHFKCKKCKIMFKIDNFTKKLLSYCTLSHNEHTFKFDREMISKLKGKFPFSHDLETSMIEYHGDVTLRCTMFNNEYFVTNIIFLDK